MVGQEVEPHSDPRFAEDFAAQAGFSQATIAAVGKVSDALETVEVARGHLYAFHRLTGTAEREMDEAVRMLISAGHQDLASRLSKELIGRNVLFGRWTFQVVEEYDEAYYRPFQDLERHARALVGGNRHLHDVDAKQQRRTRGHPGHEETPWSRSNR